MNLNCDTSTEALNELISIADSNLTAHNIVIDYDGEVIIDPELHYPHVSITKYKFYTQVTDKMLHTDEVVKVLQETLLTVYEAQSKDMYYYYDDLDIAA